MKADFQDAFSWSSFCLIAVIRAEVRRMTRLTTSSGSGRLPDVDVDSGQRSSDIREAILTGPTLHTEQKSVQEEDVGSRRHCSTLPEFSYAK